MNGSIRKLGIAVVVCYVALFVKLNHLQLVEGPSLNKRPDNSRAIERDVNRPRGTISTLDGGIVAKSDEVEGKYRFQRTYPLGDLFAHVTGTYSFLFGTDGAERTYNDELAGQTAALKLSGYLNPFVERSNVGNVTLTVRSDVQQAAKDALGDRKGSVVVLDPRSGAVIAMWSNPSYDPNSIATNASTEAALVREFLNASPDKPLLARAYRERFFPGSTFKIVTSTAGLESGKVTETSPVYPQLNKYTPPKTTRPISNFDGATCGGTLFELLKVSCNSGFAQMGAETIGPDPMIATSEKFGFNSVPPFDLPDGASSVFPTDFGKELGPGATPESAPVYENTPALAQASIGQNDVSATPLQMAMVAAAVANGGTIMAPHVMSEIRDSRGAVVETHVDQVWRQPMSAATAAILKRGMEGVVDGGTAKALAIPGFEIGGKTGTAQLGSNPPKSHAWIIGFGGPPGGAPTVAVSVLVEGQDGFSEQTGGRVAAPIAKKVLQLALAPPPAAPNPPAPGG